MKPILLTFALFLVTACGQYEESAEIPKDNINKNTCYAQLSSDGDPFTIDVMKYNCDEGYPQKAMDAYNDQVNSKVID